MHAELGPVDLDGIVVTTRWGNRRRATRWPTPDRPLANGRSWPAPGSQSIGTSQPFIQEFRKRCKHSLKRFSAKDALK